MRACGFFFVIPVEEEEFQELINLLISQELINLFISQAVHDLGSDFIRKHMRLYKAHKNYILRNIKAQKKCFKTS